MRGEEEVKYISYQLHMLGATPFLVKGGTWGRKALGRGRKVGSGGVEITLVL
jgi:hypothetical protein